MQNNLTTATRLWLFAAITILGIIVVGLSGTFSISSIGHTTHENIQSIKHKSHQLLMVENAKMAFALQVKAFKDVLIRGNNPQNYTKYKAEFKQHRSEVTQLLSKTQSLMQQDKMNTTEVVNLINLHQELSNAYQQALDQFDTNNPNAGKETDLLVKGIDRPALAAMDSLVARLEHDFSNQLEQQLVFLDQTNQEAKIQSIIICLLIMCVIITLAIWINRNVLRQLGGDPAYAAGIVKRIAEGNLTNHINIKVNDESSLLAQMYKMQSSLKVVIEQIRDASHALVGSSQQLAASSHQVATSSTQQSDASTAIAASIEELTYGISEVSNSANAAHELSSNAREASLIGAKQLKNNINDIKQIAKSIRAC